MENNEFSDLETFSKISELNKKIYKIEAQMRTLFFKNVMMDSNSEIVPPIISTKGYSGFEKIKYEIRSLKIQIKGIDKELNNLQSYNNSIIKTLMGRGLSKEEYEQEKNKMTEKIRLSLEEQRNACIEKISLIESEPVSYLRFLEFQSSDFSSVKDEDVKKKLEQQNRILIELISARNSLLKKIKKSEKKNKKMVLQLKQKTGQKGIDK